MVLTIFLGLLIGSVLGLTGAGGGILAVPALVLLVGYSMQQAAPVALIAVAGGSAIGAIEGLRLKQVRYRAAALMAVTSFPFTAFGVFLAHTLPQRWLAGLFSLVMLFVAYRLFRQMGDTTEDAATHRYAKICPESGRFIWCLPTLAVIGAVGMIAGFATGLLGVGGGFVLVPLLRRFTQLSMHGIIATSLAVIALVGMEGVLVALARGASLPLATALPFAAATAAGIMTGSRIRMHLNARQIQFGFLIVLCAVASCMLIKSVLMA